MRGIGNTKGKAGKAGRSEKGLTYRSEFEKQAKGKPRETCSREGVLPVDQGEQDEARQTSAAGTGHGGNPSTLGLGDADQVLGTPGVSCCRGVGWGVGVSEVGTVPIVGVSGFSHGCQRFSQGSHGMFSHGPDGNDSWLPKV